VLVCSFKGFCLIQAQSFLPKMSNALIQGTSYYPSLNWTTVKTRGHIHIPEVKQFLMCLIELLYISICLIKVLERGATFCASSITHLKCCAAFVIGAIGICRNEMFSADVAQTAGC
jgi:hypothetical protein